MTSIGVKLQNPLSIRENVFLAQYAEAQGLDKVWVSEYRRDAAVLMAAIAAGTERIQVGSSIVPIYSRSPAVLAMTAAAVAELAPGRVSLGLGSSTKVIIESWHESERTKPLASLRHAVEEIRRILAGTASESGFELEYPHLAAPDVMLYVAALSEKALDAAGEYADGILLNAAPAPFVPEIRRRVGAAASSSGRPAPSLGGDVRVGLGTPEAMAVLREKQRKAMSSYGRVPQYNRFFADAGFPAEAEAMRRHWQAREADAAVAAMHDGMFDEIVAIGDHDHVRERLGTFAANGLDEIVVYPLWEDGASPADAIRAIVELLAGTDFAALRGSSER